MPYEDGTGPSGEGPSTGRGFGPCGKERRIFRRGFCFRQRENIELTKEEKKKILEEELKDIESEKKEIEKTLKELKQ